MIRIKGRQLNDPERLGVLKAFVKTLKETLGITDLEAAEFAVNNEEEIIEDAGKNEFNK